MHAGGCEVAGGRGGLAGAYAESGVATTADWYSPSPKEVGGGSRLDEYLHVQTCMQAGGRISDHTYVTRIGMQAGGD